MQFLTHTGVAQTHLTIASENSACRIINHASCQNVGLLIPSKQLQCDDAFGPPVGSTIHQLPVVYCVSRVLPDDFIHSHSWLVVFSLRHGTTMALMDDSLQQEQQGYYQTFKGIRGLLYENRV